jgi:hypothetical protein
LNLSRIEFNDSTEHKASEKAGIFDANFDQHLEIWNDHSGIVLFEAESRCKVHEYWKEGKLRNLW